MKWVASSMHKYREQKLIILSPIMNSIISGDQPGDMKDTVIDTFNDWLEIEEPMLDMDNITTPKQITKYKSVVKKFINDLRLLGKIDDFWAFQIANILNIEYLPRKKSIWSYFLSFLK